MEKPRTARETIPCPDSAGNHHGSAEVPISIETLLDAIRDLPADKPSDNPKKWYRTQKEHWIGWLGEYDGPGAYGRKSGIRHDARFVYNHVVEPKMLLWLAQASGARSELVRVASSECAKAPTMQQQSSIIRRYIPWKVLAATLWPSVQYFGR